MERLTIPKFDNEADEADWLYEHRDELAAEFDTRLDEARRRRASRLEANLNNAFQGKWISISPQEIEGHSLVSVLRKKIEQSQ